MEPSRIPGKKLPIPPPLPSHSKHSIHQKRLASASPNGGCCCASTSVNSTWDRLFDEGYRADVLIHTDHDGIIYAHASVLVSSCICTLNFLFFEYFASLFSRYKGYCFIPSMCAWLIFHILYNVLKIIEKTHSSIFFTLCPVAVMA